MSVCRVQLWCRALLLKQRAVKVRALAMLSNTTANFLACGGVEWRVWSEQNPIKIPPHCIVLRGVGWRGWRGSDLVPRIWIFKVTGFCCVNILPACILEIFCKNLTGFCRDQRRSCTCRGIVVSELDITGSNLQSLKTFGFAVSAQWFFFFFGGGLFLKRRRERGRKSNYSVSICTLFHYLLFAAASNA